ncbi:DUF637 domain-containing protein [Pseudoalteromonas obscura]|uniref:DUF637 domain-containing protein n=1 Tax=Pseudoalteromonas obscura TaxID=3048491 RepID=A0ABT7EEV3_9GAMM|nr:DUF637 domain-containing protein [Pseudoalteromonas sp. P94(2023)]MDK2593800.1 DUF637 domain-containing protein [Pseudoalteromonas sp. P94(2023)]
MKKNNEADKPVPFYKKAIAYLNIFMLLGQVCLPTLAHAYNAFDKTNAAQVLASSPAFTKESSNRQTLYVKSEHIAEQSRAQNAQTIAGFHKLLLDNRKSALPSPQYIPISTGSITVIFPHYPLAKLVGDRFVQSRLIRSQIYAELNRNMISTAYADETAQITQLYQNAYELAKKGSVTFGEKVPKSVYDSFGKDFIWPEFREINGENVLSPVVHLSASTIETRTVNGHLVEFTGSDVNFRDITVNNGTLLTGRDTYLRTARNLTVNPGAQVASDGDLNLFVGGTLRNLSGSLTARDNVDIIAGQYEQKTLVHRFSSRYERGSRFGEIASVSGENIRIRSMGDIVIQGGTITGNTIGLRADGNIRLISQQTSYVNNEPVGEYSQSTSEVKHLTTKLSAKDSIYLMASGAIELKAAELHADEGVIELLAGQGIFVSNEFNQFQKQSSAKWGKTTEQEQEFQTIAVRSALEAGKGIMVASDFGDITLKAAKINSGEGTTIDARNGKVNLLLAKEQDHYFYNRVKKGTWKIKTETKQDTVDTAVYNEIIGGVKVKATHGITLELGQYEGESLQDTLNTFSSSNSLSWMSDLHNDPELSGNIDLVYQKLERIHKHDKTSTLSPAAMAVIAIAVSVAMGPGGAELIGSTGSIGSFGVINGAAMQAGALALATQAAVGLASGKGIDGTLESMLQEDSIRSLATSMVTAGILNSEAFKSLKFFSNADIGSTFFESQNAIDLANQVSMAVANATVSAGVSTLINGGDFGDFKGQFVNSLRASAINTVGEKMASKIGELADDGTIDQAVRYLSHAALGCAIGAASASANNAEKGTACASGAGGAVIGEVVADKYKSSQDYHTKQAELEGILKDLGLDESKFVGLTHEQKKALLKSNAPNLMKQLSEIKAKGVDLAKLGAGVGAFIAGAEVNIAANAGENAAEHNAFWFVLQAGYMLYKAYDLYQTIEGAIAIGEELAAAKDNPQKQIEIIKKHAISLGIDIVVGKTAAETLGSLIKIAKSKGIVPERVVEELNSILTKLESGKPQNYKPGESQQSHVDFEFGPVAWGAKVENKLELGSFIEDNKISLKSGWDANRLYDEVLKKPENGKRPPVEDYLSQEYIDSHLDRFKGGAVRFTTKDAINQFGSIGPSEAFIMPKSDFDEIVRRANGNVSEIEIALGLNSGDLSNGGTVAAHILPSELGGIRLPSGNEMGANDMWVPGGVTSGGVREAILDVTQVPLRMLKFK